MHRPRSPGTTTAQCAAVLADQHVRLGLLAEVKMCAKHDLTGGRSFFEVTDRLFPRAFHAKARSHSAIAVPGGLPGRRHQCGASDHFP